MMYTVKHTYSFNELKRKFPNEIAKEVIITPEIEAVMDVLNFFLRTGFPGEITFYVDHHKVQPFYKKKEVGRKAETISFNTKGVKVLG